MKTFKYLNLDCTSLENDSLRLLVTQSVGPRILSFGFIDSENLFAELPDLSLALPDGREFHFYGGHRLWEAPEVMPTTYTPDDLPVEIVSMENRLSAVPQLVSKTGIRKRIEISIAPENPQAIVEHTLVNSSDKTVECAPWAITQLKPGGVAILPQSLEESGLHPNRSISLWPYSNISSPLVSVGNQLVLIQANMKTGAFKMGFPNPRGWLAYWLAGTLFVKRAAFDRQAQYFDLGSSSECFFNESFLELETLGPITRLQPGASVSHTETWELFRNVEQPANHSAAQRVVDQLGLDQ